MNIKAEIDTPFCSLCGSQESSLLLQIQGVDILQCTICGLVRANKYVCRDKISTINYSESMDFYQESQDNSLAEKDFITLISKLKYHGICRGTVMDIGCGAGNLLRRFRDAGWDTMGVELSVAAARFASEHHGLEVLNMPVEEIGEPHKCVDVLLMMFVLEHLHNPLHILKSLIPWLHPGGLIIIVVPNFNSWLGKIFGGYWRPLCPWDHIWFFSQDTSIKLVEAAGYLPLEAGSLESLSDVFYLSFLSSVDFLRDITSGQHNSTTKCSSRGQVRLRGPARDLARHILDTVLTRAEPIWRLICAGLVPSESGSKLMIVARKPKTTA